MSTSKDRLKGLFVATVIGVSTLCFGSNVTQAWTNLPQATSGKQKVTFTAVGDCVDLYDEYQSEYPFYEGGNCYFKVKVTPANPQRTIALQYYEDGRWNTEVSIKTNKQGVAILQPNAISEDGYFLCTYYDYRLGVARLGTAKAALSPEFTINFIADDGYCE